MVKRFIRDMSREPEQYRGMPTIPDEFRPKMKTIGKVVVATDDEIQMNRRSRSARLRIGERDLMQPTKSRQPFLLVFVVRSCMRLELGGIGVHEARVTRIIHRARRAYARTR